MNAVTELRKLVCAINHDPPVLILAKQAFDHLFAEAKIAARVKKATCLERAEVTFDGSLGIDEGSLNVITEELIKLCVREGLVARPVAPGVVFIGWAS